MGNQICQECTHGQHPISDPIYISDSEAPHPDYAINQNIAYEIPCEVNHVFTELLPTSTFAPIQVFLRILPEGANWVTRTSLSPILCTILESGTKAGLRGWEKLCSNRDRYCTEHSTRVLPKGKTAYSLWKVVPITVEICSKTSFLDMEYSVKTTGINTRGNGSIMSLTGLAGKSTQMEMSTSDSLLRESRKDRIADTFGRNIQSSYSIRAISITISKVKASSPKTMGRLLQDLSKEPIA